MKSKHDRKEITVGSVVRFQYAGQHVRQGTVEKFHRNHDGVVYVYVSNPAGNPWPCYEDEILEVVR